MLKCHEKEDIKINGTAFVVDPECNNSKGIPKVLLVHKAQSLPFRKLLIAMSKGVEKNIQNMIPELELNEINVLQKHLKNKQVDQLVKDVFRRNKFKPIYIEETNIWNYLYKDCWKITSIK